MFRARLAGFEARAKRLLEKLSKVVKTTERYLASGKIFARATASLATDFIEMSGSFLATGGRNGEGTELGTLLRGLGDTLHEMEAGHETLLLTLEHAFIARIREFVDAEISRSVQLKKHLRKTNEAYESALHKSLSLRADQDASSLASERDKSTMTAFATFELERFRLVRYYNQLEQRKSFELVEGLCALLYSYKAHFSSSAESVTELVPHLLDLQSTIQQERQAYELSNQVWSRREDQLASTLATEGESLAMTFASGNEEYPIEAFSQGRADAEPTVDIHMTHGVRADEADPRSTSAGAGAGSGSTPRVLLKKQPSPPIDHMGYLLKLSTSVRKDWKRRWFVLQGGNLYYVRDWNDKKPTLVCEVLLSTVRVCTGPKATRHSFELISPNRRTFKLQACSAEEMNTWIAAMQQVMETLLVGGGSCGSNGSRQGGGAASTGTSEAQLRRSSSFAKKTRAGISALLAGNRQCADCSADNPEWVSINIGSIVCLRCSGVHRSLGAHITKMRSLRLDRLEPAVLSMLQRLGNAEINSIYEPDLGVMAGWSRPNVSSTTTEVKRFIRAKYEHRGFVDRIQEGTSPDETRSLLDRRIHAAAANNDVPVFLYCLAHGADVNARCSSRTTPPPGLSGLSGEKGIRENTLEDTRETPLHTAARHGSVDALLLAILNGGNLEALNTDGLTPLDVAVMCNQNGAMDCCLSHMRSSQRPIEPAARKG